MPQLFQPQSPFFARYAVKRSAHGKVVAHGQPVVEYGFLKDYADAPLDFVRRAIEVIAAYLHPSAVFAENGAQNVNRGALSRAVHAQKGEQAAALNRKRNAVHGAHFAV